MIFVRILIAVIGFLVFMTLIPALLQLMGIAVPAAADLVIKLCLACIALWYIVWGPNPRWPVRA